MTKTTPLFSSPTAGCLPSSSNRRGFLRTAGGAFAAGAIARLDVARFAHAAGSDLLRVGLIGCGARGTGAALGILKTGTSIRLVAMGDLFEERLGAALNKLQTQQRGQVEVPRDRQFIGFDAYRMVLEAGVDAVILATPPGFRPLQFDAAVNAGKHCFLETEVAVDAPGVRKLLKASEAAKAKSLTAIVGHQFRFHPGYEAIVAKVHGGLVGDITRIEALRRHSKRLWLAKRRDVEAKTGTRLTEMAYQLRNWLYFSWLSGDIAGLLSHKIDICQWAMRSFPNSVRAKHERRQATGSDFGDRSDFFSAEYTFENGVKMVAETYTLDGQPSADSEVVQGTRGIAMLKDFAITDRAGQSLWSRKIDPDEDRSQYQREQDVFIDSIRNGRRINTVDDGANVALTCVMGCMAATLGREVTRQEALTSTEALVPDGPITFDTAPPTLPDKFGDYQWPARGRAK